MESNVNERINLLLNELGYKSKRAFASKIQMSQTSFNDIINGAEPKYSTLLKILKAEPSVSPDWLLTGEGDMFKCIQKLENANNNVAIGRDANGSEIHIISQKADDFIRIMEKNQEQTDRMLSLIEKLINK